MTKAIMSEQVRRIWTTGWAVDFAIATGIGLFMALLGPYGSYDNGPIWQRALFQLPCAWLACAVIGTGMRLALAYTRGGARFWVLTVLTGAVAMVPVMLLNQLLARLIWPFLLHSMTPLTWYLQGLLVAEPASIAFGFVALHRLDRASVPAPADSPATTSKGTLGTPPDQVLCLQMEDHYVRVHTAAGSHLILATFGQALAALAAVPGLRVHRSWWVAADALAGTEQDGRNLRLVLTTGARVPVARSSIAEVRARGWLERRSG